MTKSILIKEYETVPTDLTDYDLDRLNHYLECRNLKTALKVTREGLKSHSFVGVVKYKNIQVQILPKLICNKTEDNCILRNLLYMLSYTKKLNITVNNDAILEKSKNPFLEILIREFAQSLFECLKRTTPKKYIKEEKNLKFLKGKIKFAKNIKYNYANQAKFYCEFDNFSENNILNQLFYFVATCLYNITKDNYNKKTLKFIIGYYSNIKLICFTQNEAAKIKLERNQNAFKKPFNLAKMFMEQSNIDLSKNSFENITLLWDMNKLFEEFIFELLKKYESDLSCTLTAQKGKKLLIGDNNKKRNTFVDILIEKNGNKIVLDTKYKKFSNINDFENSDVFQVSTYCLIHKANHAIILYPQWRNTKPDTDFMLNTTEDKYKIYFKTIDLQHEYLKDSIQKIKQELETILKLT